MVGRSQLVLGGPSGACGQQLRITAAERAANSLALHAIGASAIARRAGAGAGVAAAAAAANQAESSSVGIHPRVEGAPFIAQGGAARRP